MMWSTIFWLEVLERAIKTCAQSAILALGASKAFNLFTLDWRNVIGFALGGALLSVLTSIASCNIGPVGSASLLATAAASSGTGTGSPTTETAAGNKVRAAAAGR